MNNEGNNFEEKRKKENVEFVEKGKRRAYFEGISKDKDWKEEGGTAGREGIRAKYYEKGDPGEKVQLMYRFTINFQRLLSKGTKKTDDEKGRNRDVKVKRGSGNKGRELFEL